MSKKKRYTKEEATRAVGDLIAVVERRIESLDTPHAFIQEHPWAQKYLNHFAEAEDLFRKVKTGLIRIVDLTRSHQKIYAKETLLLFVTAPIGREIVFRFEKQDDGLYVALNE